MIVQLVCPVCRRPIQQDGEAWKCPACARPFTYNQGVLSFLTPEERFNESVYQENQINAWTSSAQLRDKIRNSKLLSLLNTIRVHFSLSGRRDRFFWKKMARRTNATPVILDIGCGGGRHYFCRFGKVVGIDPVLPLLKISKEIYDEVYQSSGFLLPFADNSFDYVVSTDVLGHIDHADKDQLFAEMYRVLKKGGRTLHLIESDATNPIFRFAHKHPELFWKYFMDKPGHIGLELPSQWRQRFLKHGFKEIAFQKFYSTIQEPGALAALFDNEYKDKSKWMQRAVAVDRALSRNFLLREMLNFALEPLAQVDDWLSPLDYAPGILVLFEK